MLQYQEVKKGKCYNSTMRFDTSVVVKCKIIHSIDSLPHSYRTAVLPRSQQEMVNVSCDQTAIRNIKQNEQNH